VPNDPEQQSDRKQPGQQAEAPGQPGAIPKLVFKPDDLQAARVARVRMYTILAAVVILLIALVLIISYRPPVVVKSGSDAYARAVPPIDSAAPEPTPAVGQPQVPRKAGPVEASRSAAAAIDTLVGRAAEKWMRATELLPQGNVTRDNAEDAAAKARRAVILADSARKDIATTRQQAEVVLAASRDNASRAAFRLGVLYTAIDRYVRSLVDDADDRYEYYLKSEASITAVLLGDQAESEIQQDVAMSHLRRYEERQPGIQRLTRQVREALHNIENVDK
jgi:hypothetical protein